jgi:ABC-type branched-subunit amino acid transport system ATPase component
VTTSPTIEAVGLTKHYGDVHALAGLDLVAPAGKVTAVLGPERANQKQLRAAASEIVAFLRDGQAAALQLIDPPNARS